MCLIFASALDDGHLTDNQGRQVSFKNTIVIMTSNLGADILSQEIGEDGLLKESTRQKVWEVLSRHLRPEFLNRIDDTVLFKPLIRSEVEKAATPMTNKLATRLAEQNFSLKVSADALSYIASNAYDPIYGARTIKRYVQKHLETPIARKIIAGKWQDLCPYLF